MSNQHSGADLDMALFSDMDRPLDPLPLASCADQGADRHQQVIDAAREGGSVSADDALARLLSATNASLWQVLAGGDGPLGRKREPVIGEEA